MNRSLLGLALLSTLAAHAGDTPKSPRLGPEFFSSQFGMPENLEELLRKEIDARVKQTHKVIAQEARRHRRAYVFPTIHFFVPFAYQGAGNPASGSHTFASFVEVDPKGAQKWSTISWLPADFNQEIPPPANKPNAKPKKKGICIFPHIFAAASREVLGNPCEPVPATNYDLTQTLAWAREFKSTVAVWGPFMITEDLYALSQKRIEELNSGQLKYLADDRKGRSADGSTAVNCMNAVGDMPGHYDTSRSRYRYGTWGIPGTTDVLKHYESMGFLWSLDFIERVNYRIFWPKP